jgi:glutamate dehydrogenase/leucine dehydrogenase
MYKKLTGEFTGVLTGKDVQYGGSLIRPEATGYGLVYFARSVKHVMLTRARAEHVHAGTSTCMLARARAC